MYLDNKYTKWYYNIIESAKANPFDGYTEKHHIIPKSLGGSNKKDNLVALSARQHFICHWLLTKMVDGEPRKKMWYAMNRMLMKKSTNYSPNSHTYQSLREKRSKNMSGKNNSFYGKKHTEESLEKMRRPKTDEHIKNISGKNHHHYGRTNPKWLKEKRSKILSGSGNPNASKCVVDGVVYDTVKMVTEKYCVTKETVRKRCLSDNPKWECWNYQ